MRVAASGRAPLRAPAVGRILRAPAAPVRIESRTTAGALQRQTELKQPLLLSDCDIPFAQGSATISAAAQAGRCIEAIRKYLQASTANTIELHGCASMDGDAAFNWSLSEKRAEAVKQILIEKGVSPAQIRTFARGPDASLIKAQDNRRVAVVRGEPNPTFPPLSLPGIVSKPDALGGVTEGIKTRYGIKDPEPPAAGSRPADYIWFHKEAVLLPFFFSGGGTVDFFDEKTWLKYGTDVESSAKVPARNNRLTNDYSTFYANDEITPDNFVNLMLGRFVTGIGPENFFFARNGKISNEMRDTPIADNAIDGWYEENYEALLSGAPLHETLGGNFGFFEQKKLLADKHGLLNVPQFVGSARIAVMPLFRAISSSGDGGEELLVTIRNVTSATSGDILKHFRVFGEAPSFAKDTLDPQHQQYTNISQTFSFTVKVSLNRAMMLQNKKKWAEETR